MPVLSHAYSTKTKIEIVWQMGNAGAEAKDGPGAAVKAGTEEPSADDGDGQDPQACKPNWGRMTRTQRRNWRVKNKRKWR